MLLYSTAIHHRLLKMSMSDGLVEGLCMVLISLGQISHFMLGNKPSTKNKIGHRWTESLCGCRKDFTEYADVCFREFGDRVLYWSTINEGNIFALGGYDIGLTPPQRCSPPFGNCPKGNSPSEPYIAGHHILLAHASVTQLYREKYQVLTKLSKSVNECMPLLSTIWHSEMVILVQHPVCWNLSSDKVWISTFTFSVLEFTTHIRNIKRNLMVIKLIWCCRTYNKVS